MSFLAPFYLLLGAAAAVPLLLHLMRRRIAARVDFPAARYLERAEQEHSRALKLRNLLLMLLRVLLVLALALAAARPLLNGIGIGHGPMAVAVVLDNSLSTTAVTGGVPMFNTLRDAARQLIETSVDADRIWLVTSDGRVRGGTRTALLAELSRVSPSEDAGDMPLAVRRAAAAVQGSTLPSRTIALATDGQRTAFPTALRLAVPSAVFVPRGDPPRNRAVVAARAEPLRWTPRGTVSAQIAASDSTGYRVIIGSRTLVRGTVSRSEPVAVRVSPPERGWQGLRVELEPDEFTADDSRWAAVWIGPPSGLFVDASAGPFVRTAIGSLISDGRAVQGTDVRIAAADVAGKLPALIMPPADPVRLGAANRELSRLGVPWHFGAINTAPAIVRGARLDGIAVSSRYQLVRTGAGATDTLATAAGEPWVVAGPGYVLVASRIDPAATTLPIKAAFVPWLSEVAGIRLSAPPGDAGVAVDARPGALVRLPAGADAIESATGTRRSVSGDAVIAPQERGVWFILHGSRRIGALVVNAPPEESSLGRFSAEALATRISGLRGHAAASPRDWVRTAFSAGNARPAVTPLLLIVLALLLAEMFAVRITRSAAA